MCVCVRVCVCVCAVLCKATDQTARAQQICQQAAFKGNTWLCVCAVWGSRPNCAGAAILPTESDDFEGKYVVVCVCCVRQLTKLRRCSIYANKQHPECVL